jgi:hypothetical protein
MAARTIAQVTRPVMLTGKQEFTLIDNRFY